MYLKNTISKITSTKRGYFVLEKPENRIIKYKCYLMFGAEAESGGKNQYEHKKGAVSKISSPCQMVLKMRKSRYNTIS